MMKPLVWMGSARRDLKVLPDQVRQDFGYALYLAQTGSVHPKAKSLKGFGSSALMQVVQDWQGNAYRAVYTVRFEAAVFVLHVFGRNRSPALQHRSVIWI